MFYDENGIYVIDDFISEDSQKFLEDLFIDCLLYTSPSPRDRG